MRGVRLLAAAVIAVSARPADAQVAPETLRPGARLRVQYVDAQPDVEGRLLSIGHDTLWLYRPYSRDTLRYLSSMMRGVQLATGISPTDAAVKGAAAGFVGMTIVASVHPRRAPPPCPRSTLECPAPSSRFWLIPASTFLGAVVGGFLGNERWNDVRWPPSGPWEPESAERSLVAGRHVRLDLGDGRALKARVISRTAASLTVLPERGKRADTVRLTTPEIQRIAVGSGKSRMQRGCVGAAVGAGMGAAASYYAASLNKCRGCDNVAREHLVYFVPAGLVVGALLGAHNGEEHWTWLRWPP